MTMSQADHYCLNAEDCSDCQAWRTCRDLAHSLGVSMSHLHRASKRAIKDPYIVDSKHREEDKLGLHVRMIAEMSDEDFEIYQVMIRL